MKQILLSVLVAVAAFLVGVIGHELLITQSSKSKVILPESPVIFQPDERNRGQQCRAPYYGMGAGDGVYDPFCFDLQAKLSDAARTAMSRK
jgi:hypothetical protein